MSNIQTNQTHKFHEQLYAAVKANAPAHIIEDNELHEKLNAIHISTKPMERLFAAVDDLAGKSMRLLKQAPSVQSGGTVGEDGSGFFVVGESGAGKSYSVGRALLEQSVLNPKINSQTHRLFRTVVVRSPMTQKSLAEEILRTLGVPLKTNHKLTSATLWGMVVENLMNQGVTILHLEELHHVEKTLGSDELDSLREMLKTLTNSRTWRVNLIMSGLPSTMKIITNDAKSDQLWRRSEPIVMAPLVLYKTVNRKTEIDAEVVAKLESVVKSYAAAADFVLDKTIDERFIEKLFRATGGRVGYITELSRRAVLRINSKRRELQVAGVDFPTELGETAFAGTFASWTGASVGQNPFLATNWAQLDGTNSIQKALDVEAKATAKRQGSK